ncbi:MAG: hypothetical protein U0172_03420 [Nitrospiraceae bacterium]
MSMLDLTQLSAPGRTIVAVVKEGGVVLLCLLIVGFLFGQRAGFIPDIEHEAHIFIERQNEQLKADTVEQTMILKQNQEILRQQLELMERNQKSQMRLTRGLCISVTKTAEAEQRCLGE